VGCAGAVRSDRGRAPGTLASLAAAGAARDQRDPGCFEARAAGVRGDDVAVRRGDVTLTHANLLWAARAFTGAVPVTEEDRIMSNVPLVSHHVHVFAGCQAWLSDDVGAAPTVHVEARRAWGPVEASGLLTLDGVALPGVTVAVGDDDEILARGRSIGRSPRVDDGGWLHTGTRGTVVAGRVVLS
jgi:hypothetical protein